MTTRTLLALLLLPAAAASQGLNASGGELIAEQACYDVQSYDLTLRVEPADQTIEGSLAMEAVATAPTRRVALDLDDHLEVREVRSEPAGTWKVDGRRIFVDLASEVPPGNGLRVTVDYGGTPREAPRPPWDGGFTWSETKDGSPWIATSCQGEGADLWWPCKDHPSDKPARMGLNITVPEGLVCATNGVLLSEETNDGATTWRWETRSPASNYAIALNIAPYRVLESSWTSVGGEEVPVFFYVLPEHEEQGRERLPEFIAHMRFFEELLGPYPFRSEKYGVAETPHLGMEHQTIIAYGYNFQHNAFGYDWLHHHEAAHEWWANLVTCSDWKDMWIHEGFGTYMQALYVERLKGMKGLRRELANQRRGMRNRRAVAPRDTHDSKQIYFGPDGAFDNDIYNKGSLVLHTLRWQMGDEDFFRALRTFAYPDEAHRKATDGSQVRLVDTEDFVQLCEGIEEADLGWFFEVYIRQPKLPELEVERSGSNVKLRWNAAAAPFPLDVPVRVTKGEKRRDVRVTMEGGAGTLKLARGEEFEIDPDLWLLRKPR
ncbi:MAG: M1 family metallopeptidase [Planctomycetota bacterium]